MAMKILQVITGMAKASGVTTFVENVVPELRSAGHEVEIVTNATAHRYFADRVGVGRAEDFDIIHIHGLWSPLLHRAARFAVARGMPVVWSTHGMTAPWSMRHKRWKKIVAWHLYQRRDLKSADLVHCTTELEGEWNRRLGFDRIVLAPLGASLGAFDPDEIGRALASRTLLYVGRIYPVKALDNLIRAFSSAAKEHPGWKLRIVGPDQAGHRAQLEALCAKIGVSGVEFAGPKYGDELDAEYARCSALALVSHTENFGATVVDALAHGKSVVTSTRTPWKIVAERDCGWWVDNSPAVLAGALGELFSTPDAELVRRGTNGRRLVEELFAWPVVAHVLDQAYQTLGQRKNACSRELIMV